MGLNLESKSNNKSGLRGDEGTYFPGWEPVQTLHGYSTKIWVYEMSPGYLFLLFKSISSDNFPYFLRHLITKLQTKGIKLYLLFKLLYLNSNFLLTLCYLTPVVQSNISGWCSISYENFFTQMWASFKIFSSNTTLFSCY